MATEKKRSHVLSNALVDAGTDIIAEMCGQEAQIERLRGALATIRDGVDHPDGIEGAPQHYEAMRWAQQIAEAALAGKWGE